MGWLQSLFGKKEPQALSGGFTALGTDIHSHFIPGIDDGAQTPEESIALLQRMQQLGYKKVITTPHVMSDHYRNTPEIILRGRDALREIIAKENIALELDAAAEYYLDHEFEAQVKAKSLLTFGDAYVLFELPFIAEPPMLDRVVFELQTAGYRPVLAHVERYFFYHSRYDRILALREKGVLLQLNINSIGGYYSPAVRKLAERLIDDKQIDMLGSDCHHIRHLDRMERVAQLPYFHKAVASGMRNAEL